MAAPDAYIPRDDVFRMVELATGDVEYREADTATDDGTLGTLRGYVAVFNSPTEINSWEGRFTEQFAPGSFKRTIQDFGPRVKVLFNHGFDPSIGEKPLGRIAVLEERTRGLWMEVPLDDTSYNRDLVPLLKSGAIDGMSIRFSVSREEWDQDEEPPMRTIREVARLHEGGPVTFPAYEATTAGVRSRTAYEAWRHSHPVQEPAESDVTDDGTSDEAAGTPPDVAPAVTERARTIRDRVMEDMRASIERQEKLDVRQ